MDEKKQVFTIRCLIVVFILISVIIAIAVQELGSPLLPSLWAYPGCLSRCVSCPFRSLQPVLEADQAAVWVPLFSFVLCSHNICLLWQYVFRNLQCYHDFELSFTTVWA